MTKNVLVIASNYGLWAEELQAPWDALQESGHQCTLATYKGKIPLPFEISMDPTFRDPKQDYLVNPEIVVNRVKTILDTGEWDNPRNVKDVSMNEFDAIVIVGGPGAPLDITGNMRIHQLLLDAYHQGKVIGALCYAVAALAFTRDPDNNNRSIIYGKTVTAHPHEWDFDFDMAYPLYRNNVENPGTDLVTSGFVFPLQYMTEDAVGPDGKVISDATANREKPCVAHDGQFVTALSVESSRAFGETLKEVLSR
jgi:putative intracellular protease/amidase